MKWPTIWKKLRAMRGQFKKHKDGTIFHKTKMCSSWLGSKNKQPVCPLNAILDEPVPGNYVPSIASQLEIPGFEASELADAADNNFGSADCREIAIRKRLIKTLGLRGK